MKRLVSFILALCMVFALAACGKDDTTNNNPTNNNPSQGSNAQGNNNAQGDGAATDTSALPTTLTIGTTKKVTVAFDGANEAHKYGFALCCDMLVYIDSNGEVKSNILESWESTNEGLTMTLKEGITFTDGKPCTAEDILFTFVDANERGMGDSSWTVYFDWDNAKISNNGLTLFIPTPEPYAPGIIALTRTSAYIKCKAFVEEHPYGDEIWWDTVEGTGPYECVEQVDGAYVKFKLRDNYWGDEEYVYDEIQVNYYSDQNAIAIELENGVIDVAMDVNSFTYNQFGEKDGFTTMLHGEGNITCVSFDETLVPAVANPKVREAIALAFNADEAGIVGADGMYAVADSVLPSTCFGYKPLGTYNNGSEADIAKAKQLMAEAGYPEGFSCLLSVRDRDAALGEVAQGALAKIGIKCEFEALEFMNMIMKEKDGKVECTVTQLQTDNSGEPSDVYSKFTTNNDTPLGVIQDKEFNELCDKANKEVDPAKREALVNQILDFIYDGNYRVYLYEAQKAWIYKNGVVPEGFDAWLGNNPGGFRLVK